MAIQIGKYTFNGPYSRKSSLPNSSGVYAVLKPTANLSVVDIGESAKIHDRVSNHEREGCWKRNSGQRYAYLLANKQDRERIERELRRKYNPPCGDR